MKGMEIVAPAVTLRGQFKTSDREALTALAATLAEK